MIVSDVPGPISLLKDLFQFLASPDPEESKHKNVAYKAIGLLSLLVFTLILSLSAYYLSRHFFHPPLNSRLFKIEEHFGPSGLFVFIVLAIPVVEECLFRLPMRYHRISLSVAMFILAYDQISRFVFHSPKYLIDDRIWEKLILSLFCGLGFLAFQYIGTVHHMLQRFWQNHFSLLVYFISLSFALMHILNFQYNQIALYLWPLITLPQLILGFTTAYARIRFGFMYGVLLHALYNSSFYWLPHS